ncbi:MAG: N-acetylneuraminic acid mutarotase, partial [Myxococcota bacterium]
MRPAALLCLSVSNRTKGTVNGMGNVACNLILVSLWAGSGCGSGLRDSAADTHADGVDSTAPDTAPDVANDTGTSTSDAPATGTQMDSTEPPSGWVTLESVPGGTIQEHAVVERDGVIYLLGGFRNGFNVVSDVLTYTIADAAWSEAPAMPEDLHHVNAAAVIGDSSAGGIYVLGALEGQFQATDVAWHLSANASAWRAITPMPSERRRGASSIAVVGSDVFVLGGLRGGAVVDASIYHAATDSWEPIADIPTALDHASADVINGTVYLIGGRDTSIDAFQAALYSYDAPDDVWETLTAMPTGRGGHVSAVVADRIYVAGGEGNPADDTRGVFPQVEAYDSATGQWTTLDAMLTPRH